MTTVRNGRIHRYRAVIGLSVSFNIRRGGPDSSQQRKGVLGLAPRHEVCRPRKVGHLGRGRPLCYKGATPTPSSALNRL